MTTLSILGAGNMARGIATRALAGGHGVQILSRDPKNAEALAKDLEHAAPGAVTVGRGSVGDALVGEIVVLAVPYDSALALVEQYGRALDGKVVLDITNPIKETFDGLATPLGSSGAEEIAKVAPESAKVVKAFNTTFASVLPAGQVGGRPVDVFIAGDDADAKAVVAAVVEDGGLRPIDVGPASAAHALEAIQFVHIGLQFSRGTQFGTAIAIVD